MIALSEWVIAGVTLAAGAVSVGLGLIVTWVERRRRDG